jgi:hypothetical protein
VRKTIEISVGGAVVEGELNDGQTATLIWEALPIEGSANRWGEEIYFSIPVETALDDTAHDVVERGALGYWPQGRALCIFFGPTPASQGNEIRPASPVNVVGAIRGDLQIFKEVTKGMTVQLQRSAK